MRLKCYGMTFMPFYYFVVFHITANYLPLYLVGSTEVYWKRQDAAQAIALVGYFYYEHRSVHYLIGSFLLILCLLVY